MAREIVSEEPEDDGAPRRSGRERKVVQRLGKYASDSPGKRRRIEGGSDEEVEEQESEDEVEEPVESEEEDEFEAPKAAAPARRRTSRGGKASRGTTRRRPAKKKKGSDDEDGAPIKGDVLKGGDYKIKNDNTLFNAVRNPGSSLADILDDWIQQYQENDEARGEAMAQLVNFVIRCCGCNASVDRHEAEDLDGAASKLEDLQEEFKHTGSRSYPLTAKAKALKAFRKSLNEFIDRLIKEADNSEILYDNFFCEALQSWLAAATSSKLRSFRHTATVIALELVTALCPIAIKRNNGLSQASRARDKEKEKRSPEKEMLKSLEARVKAAHQKKVVIEQYLKELFEAVFINRYRDAEPAIRSECVKALGQWMKLHPEHFLAGNHLRYIGWVLTDMNKETRLEATRALSHLYAKGDHIGLMRHFTERFKGRLVEMASREVDLSVRIAAIDVLRHIATHGLLEDEQLDQLARLIFHVDNKVRRAVAGYFLGTVDEEVKTKREDLALDGSQGKKKSSGFDADQLRLKCLAEALVKHGRALDDELGVDEEETEEANKSTARAILSRKSRITDAVLALLASTDEKEEWLHDWQLMADYLVLDHSASGDGDEEATVDEAVRLEEQEESVMLEIFVASLSYARDEATREAKKDAEAETVISDITRAMIKTLPKLFTKYKTDARRIVDVLSIPAIIDLELYLTMRVISSYETLWDDVVDVFTQHANSLVLDQAAQAITIMRTTDALSQTNDTKLTELDDTLVKPLREAIVDKDPASASFDVDDLRKLEGVTSRLATFIAGRDISSIVEVEVREGTTVFQVLDALAGRGRLGYEDEEVLLENVLSILFYYLAWKTKELLGLGDAATDIAVEAVREVQQPIVNRLEDLMGGEASNTRNAVKEAAFAYLLDLHAIFANTLAVKDDRLQGLFQPLKLDFDETTPYRLSGFVQAEIDRYIELLGYDIPPDEDEPSGSETEHGTTEGDDDAPPVHGNKRKAGKKHAAAKKKAEEEPKIRSPPRTLNERQLKAQIAFRRVLSTFVRCINVGVLEVRHASVVLAHFQRFDGFFDTCARLLIDVLRAQGVHGDNGDDCATVMIESLRDASELIIDGQAKEGILLALARALVAAVVARGAQLAIVGKLAEEHLSRVHTELITHLVKKYAALDAADASVAKKERSLLLFKALGQFTSTLSGRAALKIQGHMDEAIKKASITVSPTSKLWDVQRAYAKRLATAMSKDSSIKKAATKKRAETDDEAEDAAAELNGHAAPVVKKRKSTAGRPKPRPANARTSYRRKSRNDHDDDEEDDELAGDEDDESGEGPTEVLPAKTTGRTRTSIGKRKRTPSPAPTEEHPEDEAEVSETEMAPPTVPTRPERAASQESVSLYKRKRAV